MGQFKQPNQSNTIQAGISGLFLLALLQIHVVLFRGASHPMKSSSDDLNPLPLIGFFL